MWMPEWPMPVSPVPGRGRVVAVCAGPRSLAKEPLPEARVTSVGIPGDAHHGPTQPSKDGPVPNDRPITAVAAEASRAACSSLGIAILPPGAFGENFLLEGLGDLAHLAAGDRLRIGREGAPPAVVLEVTRQNPPCKRLCAHHPGLLEAMVGRRGVICAVRQEGIARPGDVVEVVRAPSA